MPYTTTRQEGSHEGRLLACRRRGHVRHTTDGLCRQHHAELDPVRGLLDVKTSAQTGLPRSESYQVTTFGNFEFRAQAPGKEPFYGLLPLKFNGGYLALDILFLAPLAFANLRSVFPYYEIDLDQRVVKYKRRESDAWTVYAPKPEEAARAKNFFDK